MLLMSSSDAFPSMALKNAVFLDASLAFAGGSPIAVAIMYITEENSSSLRDASFLTLDVFRSIILLPLSLVIIIIFAGSESVPAERKLPMKIIVMSDSHGSMYNMRALFAMHPDADMYIHLGDGCDNFVDFCAQNGKPYSVVRGNCDFYSGQPTEETVTVDGKVIFLTHGHMYGAKYTTERLINAGREHDADIILFGHTHEPLCEYIDDDDGSKPFYLINPGSISQPRSGNPTYALIITQKGRVLPNIASLY